MVSVSIITNESRFGLLKFKNVYNWSNYILPNMWLVIHANI